jgi:hypothetical protein
MNLHPPKPQHGWREFVGEVGIIFLGVLIALAAEQVVETIHGSVEAKYARQAIRTELETNMARLRSRAVQRPCVQRRLGEIQALLDGPAGQKAFESRNGLAALNYGRCKPPDGMPFRKPVGQCSSRQTNSPNMV